MKIMLIMKDAEGRKAQIVAEGEWDAFHVGDIEAVKRFEPVEYCEITLAYDDGGMYLHGYFPKSFSSDDVE